MFMKMISQEKQQELFIIMQDQIINTYLIIMKQKKKNTSFNLILTTNMDGLSFKSIL